MFIFNDSTDAYVHPWNGCYSAIDLTVRDRPYNLQGGGLGFFVSFRDMRVSINFFVARSAHFFQNVTLGCMAKTLNQIIFCFPPTKSEYFFQLNSTIGERTASYHFDKADWLLYKQMCREKIQIQMMRNVADPILKFNEIAD